MNLETSLFYFLACISVLSALLVIFSTNPVKSVIYLIVTFFSIAGHFVLLNAQFLAAVHVIVYAGAIMVLFLFVIMLLNLNRETEASRPLALKLSAVISAGLMLVILTGTIKNATLKISETDISMGLIHHLGLILFNEYALPFEVSALLFLTAMVGAVMLSKKENSENL